MMVIQEETPTNKDKGLRGGQYARTEEVLYKEALALLEKCKIEPGRSGQEIPEFGARHLILCCDAERVGFSDLGPSAYLRRVQFRREWRVLPFEPGQRGLSCMVG